MSSRVPRTPEEDLILLQQFGFDARKLGSKRYNERTIRKLKMRQLDRLKMLLTRSEPFAAGLLPKAVRMGITRNRADAFAEALTYLPPRLGAAGNSI